MKSEDYDGKTECDGYFRYGPLWKQELSEMALKSQRISASLRVNVTGTQGMEIGQLVAGNLNCSTSRW